MKKFTCIALLMVFGVLLGSCSKSDDGMAVVPPVVVDPIPDPVEANVLFGKWTPNQVAVVMAGVELIKQAYPHQENCDRDLLELRPDMQAVFTYHIADCTASTETQKWSESGDQLRVTIWGSEIQGTVLSKSNTAFVLQANASAYQLIIEQLYPGVVLLPNSVIQLSFSK